MPKQTDNPAGKEQQLLRHARREGLLIMAVWAGTPAWGVGPGFVLGYFPPPGASGLIFGIPPWGFWGAVRPRGLCPGFSVWFCFAYMADDDLGQDPEEGSHV